MIKLILKRLRKMYNQSHMASQSVRWLLQSTAPPHHIVCKATMKRLIFESVKSNRVVVGPLLCFHHLKGEQKIIGE